MDSDKAEVSSKVRDVAEKSLDQARGAVGTLLDAARSTAESIQATTKTSDTPEGLAVAKGFGFAKENIGAIFDFAQRLVKAPDLKGAVDMQAEFVKQQAEIMQKQIEELKSLSPTTKA